jgi:hypothetical protein
VYHQERRLLMNIHHLILATLIACAGCGDGTSDPGPAATDTPTPGDDTVTAEDTVPTLEDTAPADDTVATTDTPAPKDTVLPDLPEETIEPGDPPTPVLAITEGGEVIPQTLLHLHSEASTATSGAIAQRQWSAVQPAGSVSRFIPSPDVPNPTFEVNVAGHYVFSLDVWDAFGQQSAEPAMMQVDVIPDEAIHVELLWHNPEDPDESDEGPEAGADMDLHFVHYDYALEAGGPDLDGDGQPDGWFDQPFDCFWFNAHPEWGIYDPDIDDNPGLDLDDTDGAGPENINLALPEAVTYRVGVHHWNDHGYGPGFATVRVYIEGVLVWESELTKLFDSDMWQVVDILWAPEPGVPWLLSTDSAKITPNYQNPFFFQD